MKTIAVVILCMGLAVMAGCAQIQAKIVADAQPILTADLDKALAVANERPQTEQLPIQCYSGLKTWVASLPSTASTFVDPSQCTGLSLICGGEVARIGIEDASAPAPPLPPLDSPTWNACVVAFADTKIAAAKLAAVMAGLAKGAGLANQAAGLKAEAAALGKP